MNRIVYPTLNLKFLECNFKKKVNKTIFDSNTRKQNNNEKHAFHFQCTKIFFSIISILINLCICPQCVPKCKHTLNNKFTQDDMSYTTYCQYIGVGIYLQTQLYHLYARNYVFFSAFYERTILHLVCNVIYFRKENNYLYSVHPYTYQDILFPFVLFGSQYLYVQVDATMVVGVESYSPVVLSDAQDYLALDALVHATGKIQTF